MALSGKASASWERIFGRRATGNVSPPGDGTFRVVIEGATETEDGTITWTAPFKYVEVRDPAPEGAGSQ